MGKNGKEEWLKECPAHRMIPDKGGNTSVDSISYFTFDCIVWFNFTFLKRVL